MSHRALIAVVDGKRATVVCDRWAGARAIDLLHAPVDAVDTWTSDQQQLAEVTDSAWEAGILVDRTRSRVLWFGSPLTGYIGEDEAPPKTLAEWQARIDASWSAFAIEQVDGVPPLAYLADHRVEIEPPTLDADDLGRIVDAMIPDRLDVDARREELKTADAALPRPATQAARGNATWWLWPVFLVLFVPALVLRLVLRPFRSRLRARLRRRFDRHRAKQVAAMRTLDARINADPNDHEARIDRALYFDVLGRSFLADAELETVIRATKPPDRLHLLALHNRGVVRHRLMLPALATADLAAARDAGYRSTASVLATIRLRLAFVFVGFKLIAGIPIDPDDD